MHPEILKDLEIVRPCECCNKHQATYLMVATTKCLMGFFHVCSDCKDIMDGEGNEYSWYNKITKEKEIQLDR